MTTLTRTNNFPHESTTHSYQPRMEVPLRNLQNTVSPGAKSPGRTPGMLDDIPGVAVVKA